MKVSEFVQLSELTYSDKAKRLGIDNMPNDVQLTNLKVVCNEVFDKVRGFFKVPIFISSAFRGLALNKATPGASLTSQHSTGEALDLDADRYGKITNSQIFNYIKDNLEFDQLIWEYGNAENPDWVHVSKKTSGNRKEILRAIKVGSKTKYIKYA